MLNFMESFLVTSAHLEEQLTTALGHAFTLVGRSVIRIIHAAFDDINDYVHKNQYIMIFPPENNSIHIFFVEPDKLFNREFNTD